MKNQDAIDGLNCSKNMLKIVKYLLESTVETCSIEQAFVCLRELEYRVENIEKGITRKGNKIKTNGIKLNTTEMFQHILKLGPNETHLLASITMPEANIVLPVYKDRQFLRKCTVYKTRTHEILLGRNGPNSISVPTYSDIQFLPDNRFPLTDSYYGICCIVTEDCIISKQNNIYGGPVNPLLL